MCFTVARGNGPARVMLHQSRLVSNGRQFSITAALCRCSAFNEIQSNVERGMNMGRRPTDLAAQTRVRAWAEMAVAAGQCEPGDLMSYFRKPGAKRGSTTIYKCLEEGRPKPALRLPQGEPGPALLIEQHVPGSLKWLIHPMWKVLDQPDNLSIGDLHQHMAALDPTVVSTLFKASRPSLARRSPMRLPDCETLFAIGSLDALAALLYLGLEAMAVGDLTGIRAVERTVRHRVPTWECLQALTQRTRRSLEVLLRNAVHSADVIPVNSEDARYRCALKAAAEYSAGPVNARNWEETDLERLCQVLGQPECRFREKPPHRKSV